MRHLNLALVVALGWLALPSAASAQAVLTPEQFAAIDAVYVAFAAFNDDDGATAADRVAARAACSGLGSTGAMLSGLRRSCGAQLRVGQALGATERCRGRTSCLREARRVRRALSELILFARASNRNVNAAGLAPACARELRVSLATLTYYTRLRNGFALLERALIIRSVALARRAERRVATLREPDRRSIAQQREDYRTGCARPS